MKNKRITAALCAVIMLAGCKGSDTVQAPAPTAETAFEAEAETETAAETTVAEIITTTTTTAANETEKPETSDEETTETEEQPEDTSAADETAAATEAPAPVMEITDPPPLTAGEQGAEAADVQTAAPETSIAPGTAAVPETTVVRETAAPDTVSTTKPVSDAVPQPAASSETTAAEVTTAKTDAPAASTTEKTTKTSKTTKTEKTTAAPKTSVSSEAAEEAAAAPETEAVTTEIQTTVITHADTTAAPETTVTTGTTAFADTTAPADTGDDSEGHRRAYGGAVEMLHDTAERAADAADESISDDDPGSGAGHYTELANVLDSFRSSFIGTESAPPSLSALHNSLVTAAAELRTVALTAADSLKTIAPLKVNIEKYMDDSVLDSLTETISDYAGEDFGDDEDYAERVNDYISAVDDIMGDLPVISTSLPSDSDDAAEIAADCTKWRSAASRLSMLNPPSGISSVHSSLCERVDEIAGCLAEYSSAVTKYGRTVGEQFPAAYEKYEDAYNAIMEEIGG